MKKLLPLIAILLFTLAFSKAQAQCNPDFNYSIQAGYVVNFTAAPSTSAGLSDHWNYGDGSFGNGATSSHTYSLSGTYNVWHYRRILINNNIICYDSAIKTITIAAGDCNLVANLAITQANTSSNTIYVSNTSTPSHSTDSVRYSFGDGTAGSGPSATHSYMQAGTYNVCIRVQQRNNQGQLTNCIKEKCQTVTIAQDSCALQVNFLMRLDSTAGNLRTYKFTNQSVPLSTTDSIRWTFGDGTSSSAVHPVHTYSQAGTYIVCLRVIKRNSAATLGCARDICKTLVITECPLQAAYTKKQDSTNWKKFYFTNTSVAPAANTVVLWTFGDGSSATTWNAVHEYATAGRYRVCLKISLGNTCVREICDSVTVAEPCVANSNYSYQRSASNYKTYSFTPSGLYTNATYTWSFGDGTSSSIPNPTHTYVANGTYIVCLKVNRGANCESTTCKSIQVQNTTVSACDSATVNFTAVALQPALPHKITFTATGSRPIIAQKWVITKYTNNGYVPYIILTTINPTYTFADSGTYRVCLLARMDNNCIREKCQQLIIVRNTNGNDCHVNPYPNPATAHVSTNVYLTQPQQIKVYIFNNQQTQVRYKLLNGTPGQNVITIEMLGLPAGIYTMKVVRGNRQCTAAFMKL